MDGLGEVKYGKFRICSEKRERTYESLNMRIFKRKKWM